MKKLLLFVFAFVSSISYSQDIYDKLAQETCDCISAKKLDLSSPSNNLKTEFISCFFKSYSAHTAEVEKVEKIDLTNEEQMSKFGEKIAFKMVSICPDVIMALGQTAQDEEAAESATQFATVEGDIMEIKVEQFVTIVVKDKKARIHNFMLLDYFETAALFTNNQIKKNDKISVTFSEIEMYDPKIKEFRNFKIISDLQKK